MRRPKIDWRQVKQIPPRFWVALALSLAVNLWFYYRFRSRPLLFTQDMVCYARDNAPDPREITASLDPSLSSGSQSPAPQKPIKQNPSSPQKKPEGKQDKPQSQQKPGQKPQAGKPGGKDKSLVFQDSFQEKNDFAEKLGLDKKKHGDLIKRLRSNYKLQRRFMNTLEDLLPGNRVPDSYVRRDRKYDQMIIRDVLPSIHNIERDFEELVGKAPEILDEYNERNAIIENYKRYASGRKMVDPEKLVKLNIIQDPKPGKQPLEWPAGKRQKYFDRTLPLEKETQLARFFNRFVRNHDFDKGDLPLALRQLYYDNIQRIARKFSSDPTYFYIDYFEENLNKENFLKNALYWANRMKGTRAGTELLFILENIYDIQQRAVSFYFQAARQLRSIPPKKVNELRVQTLARIIERYRPILAEKGIPNTRESDKLYYERRLQVLDYILDSTPQGYRRSDALFTKAEVLWSRGQSRNKPADKLAALKIWQGLNFPSGSGDDETSKFTRKKEIWQKIRPEVEKLLSLAPGKSQLKSPSTPARRLEYKISRELRMAMSRYLTQKDRRERRLLWKK